MTKGTGGIGGEVFFSQAARCCGLQVAGSKWKPALVFPKTAYSGGVGGFLASQLDQKLVQLRAGLPSQNSGFMPVNPTYKRRSSLSVLTVLYQYCTLRMCVCQPKFSLTHL